MPPDLNLKVTRSNAYACSMRSTATSSIRSVFGFVRDTYKIIESFLDHQPLPQEDDATWLALLGTD